MQARRRAAAISEHEVDIRLVHPVAVVLSQPFRAVVSGGHAGRHDGDLHDHCCDIKISHGSVALVVGGGDQTTRNTRIQVQATDAWALVRAPENSPEAPLACVVHSVPCGVWW